MTTVAELNDRLDRVGDIDDRRHVAARRITVADHFELEAIELQALPAERFDPASVLSCRVFWDVARRRLGDRDGTRALIGVLLLHRQLSAAAVDAGMNAALAVGSVDVEVVEIEARRHVEDRDAVIIPIGEHLARFDRPHPP